MRKKLLIIGTACLIVIMIAVSFMIFQSKSLTSQKISDESTQTKLYLTPASGQFAINSPIETVVTLDAGSNSVSGFSTTLEYDSSKLSYVTYEKQASLFDSITVNSSTDGKIILVLEADPTAALPTGNGINVVKIKFNSKSSTGGAVFSFADNTVVGSTYTQILTSTGINSTYQIGGTTSITPNTSTSPTISPSITAIISPSITTPPENCLPYGDVDGNGSVSNADLNLATAYLNKTGTLTVGQFSRADVNRDTLVNIADTNAITELAQGKWTTVFPGNPLLCPQLLPFHIGFKEKNVTLNIDKTTPTTNNVVISNPYKLPITSVTFRGAYNSSAIRVTGVKALKGSMAFNYPDILQDSFTVEIDFPTPVKEQEFEVAGVEVIPYVPGGVSTASITFSGAHFKVDVQRAGNETIPGATVVEEGKANYTVVRTGISQAPSTIPTINASPPVGGASLKITAGLPGIGTRFASDNKNPVVTGQRAAVQLIGSGNATPINASGNLYFNGNDYTGYVIVPSIAKGNYQVKVKFNTTLYKTIPGLYYLSDTQSVNTTPVRLTNGDFNLDQRLDLLDYNIMLSCTQKKPACNQAMQEYTDLNSDGKVSEADYSIFVRQFDVREGD